MRSLTIAVVALALALAVAVPAASSEGVTSGTLEKANWTCVDVLGAIHCAPPGGLERVGTGEARTMTFLVFSTDDGAFLGTELIIRADLFHGQPCPTDPPSMEYTHLLPLIGLDYYACHRYDSSF